MAGIVSEFTKGLWKELPPFRLVLGLCPILAVTKTGSDGFGMGMAVIFVLTFSNLIISLVRKLIPKKVRIACFIAITASLVVSVEMLMQAFSYPLYQSLGIFVPLIVVNCLILGRAEAFAGKNPVHLSIADGLGMGIGFTVSLTFLGSLRELLGNGTIFGSQIMWDGFQPFEFRVEAPGAFVSLGLILGVMNYLTILQSKRKGEAAAAAGYQGCDDCMACARATGIAGAADDTSETPDEAEIKEA
jgi:electron transport complex protein RnfE